MEYVVVFKKNRKMKKTNEMLGIFEKYISINPLGSEQRAPIFYDRYMKAMGLIQGSFEVFKKYEIFQEWYLSENNQEMIQEIKKKNQTLLDKNRENLTNEARQRSSGFKKILPSVSSLIFEKDVFGNDNGG